MLLHAIGLIPGIIPMVFMYHSCSLISTYGIFLLTDECLLKLFSKILGYALIVLVATIQWPQILRVLSKRSGEGISTLSVILMLQASSTSVAYNLQKHFPLSTWGESILLMAQYLILSCLLLLYNKRPTFMLGFLFLYVPFMLILLLPLVPPQGIIFMKALNLPIVTVSKIVQIYTNYKHKGAGEVSITTTLLVNLRAFGRLTTTAIETKDLLLVLNYSQNCLWNTILSCQTVYYKRRRKLKNK
ncbi:hypothetical protein SNE40_001087 [Patella caerulea]